MRTEIIFNEEYPWTESPDGWRLYAPGSTSEQIDSGKAPCLASGTGRRPNKRGYLDAMRKLCPWAAVIIPLDDGYKAYESAADAPDVAANIKTKVTYRVLRWCCTSGLCVECHRRGNHGNKDKRERVVQADGLTKAKALKFCEGWKRYEATMEKE